MIRRRGNSRNHRRPRGITIIEILIVVTCVAIALGLCAVTIQLLLRLAKDGQARYNSQAGLERLARQLRGDAHAAAQAQVDGAVDGKAAVLSLALAPKHSVSYEPRKSAVMRVESRDGSIVRRELYALPSLAAIHFEKRAEAGRQFVALVATSFSKLGGTGSNRALEAVALVGKDRAKVAAAGGGRSR
jgi:hypothetical protein